jgi:hypothetical protein
MAARKLTIDKEFAGLCPDLTAEEESQLEASIAADGCRDEIVTWANHKDTILDGHHRYKICERLGKTFKTTALRFDSREECIEWIIRNQLGRRNVTEENKSYLRGKLYNEQKKDQGGDRKSKCQSGTLIDTAADIAEETGVSRHTIQRDAEFAEAVDTIAEVAGPEAKAEILAGDSPLGKAAVVKASKLPKAKMANAVATGKLPAAPKSGKVVDALDHKVPEHLVPVFENANKFDKAMTLCTTLTKAINELRDDQEIGVVFAGRGVAAQALKDVENVRHALKFAKPYAVCPYCKAKGCNACCETGWVGEGVYRSAPKEKR